MYNFKLYYMYYFESMFYIFCVLIIFLLSMYYVCGIVGVDFCKMCNFVIFCLKIESY